PKIEKGGGAMPVATTGPRQETARSSNLRVAKQFTDLDKDRFLHEGFEYIAKFFENSLKELVRRNSGMDEAISVKADDQTLYFGALGLQSYGSGKEKLSIQGAAELFWGLFIRPL